MSNEQKIKFSELDILDTFNQANVYVAVLDGNDTSMSASGSNKRQEIKSLIEKAGRITQGYYSVLSDFYFDSGVATETEIDAIDTWTDVLFDVHESGTFDFRPIGMQEADATGWDSGSGFFNLEGLTLTAFCSFRASFTFEPDDDEGQLEVRLFFNRHTGTVPNDPFPIESVALTMNQGAGKEYPADPILSFFVGDTIDTNGVGDAGKCKFQVKSTVPGTIYMRALTWYINK